ncbi:hypothetical protein AAHC03_026710 [Spirometra sp. Aus1]
MSTPLSELLTAATSPDPVVMQEASNQLQLLSSVEGKPADYFISSLADSVFNEKASSPTLSEDARLLGLIYLKNSVFNQQFWRQVPKEEQRLLLDSALRQLERGAGSGGLNAVELATPHGRFVAEIISGVLRSEWLGGNCPDALWLRLTEWCAWLTLRRCIQRAASFRLPPRRRQLARIISDLLLPPLLVAWHEQNASCPAVAHVLYTCLISLDAEVASPLLAGHPELCAQCLQHLSSTDSAASEPRLCKLTHAVFINLPEAERSASAVHLVKKLFDVVVLRSESSATHGKAVFWLLALLYNLLAASFDVPLAGAFCKTPSLSPVVCQEIHNWLLTPHNGSLTCLTLVCGVMQHWMSLQMQLEVEALFSLPEACYSSGGVRLTPPTSGNLDTYMTTLSAPALWDADGRIPAGYVLAGNQDLLTARQLAESIIVLLTHHLADQLSQPLLQMLQTLYAATCTDLDDTGSGLSRELLLRCVQLSLGNLTSVGVADAAAREAWCAWTDQLISSEFRAFELLAQLGKQCPGDLVAICRCLALLVRRAVILPKNDSSGDLLPQCSGALNNLLHFLLPSSTSFLPRTHSVALRMTAVHCFRWLIQHPQFRASSLTDGLLPQFLESLLLLAQDTEECETQLIILNCLRSLPEVLDIQTNPALSLHFLKILDSFWAIGERAPALRASILDLIALLMQGLNSSAVTGAASGGLAFELQERVVDIVGKDLTLGSSLSAGSASNKDEDVDNDDVDDSADTLFEPSLRLWHSLVSGPGSAWSSGLDRLLPVLTGSSAMVTAEATTNYQPSFDNPLYARLESSEQARLYFDIAQGCLRLATTGVQSPRNFLHRWTEPFWAPALADAVTHNQMRADCVAAKLSLNQAPTDTAESDEESALVVQQLTLLSQWLSRLLVLTPGEPIPPSPCGLLLLHSNACLTKSPVEVHDDVAFKANRARLLLLAQLACFPERRLFLLRLLTLSYTNPGDLDFAQACLELSATPLSPLTMDTTDASERLFQPLLSRILTRADCLTDYLARRCFIVAAFVCLVHMVNPHHYLAATSGNSQVSLETLIATDTVHATWLEPIISLAVQILCEGQQQRTAAVAVDEGDCGLWLPPPTVASLEGSRGLLRTLLQFWQERVGGDAVASEILLAYVDPAILEQFHRQLNQPLPTLTAEHQ